jgi:hypothetical protein
MSSFKKLFGLFNDNSIDIKLIENKKKIAEFCCETLFDMSFKVNPNIKISNLFHLLIFFLKNGEICYFLDETKKTNTFIPKITRDIVSDNTIYESISGMGISNLMIVKKFIEEFYQSTFQAINIPCHPIILNEIKECIDNKYDKIKAIKICREIYLKEILDISDKTKIMEQLMNEIKLTINSDLNEVEKQKKLHCLCTVYENIEDIMIILKNDNYEIMTHNYNAFINAINKSSLSNKIKSSMSHEINSFDINTFSPMNIDTYKYD